MVLIQTTIETINIGINSLKPFFLNKRGIESEYSPQKCFTILIMGKKAQMLHYFDYGRKGFWVR